MWGRSVVIVAIIIIVVTFGIFKSQSNDALQIKTSVVLDTHKDVAQERDTEPQSRTVEQPVKIFGATKEEIRFSIEESQRTTAAFQPKMPVLSSADQKRLDDAVKQILETKAALSKFENFNIPLQEAGRSLKISSVKLLQSGFITVWRSPRTGLLLGSTKLLKAGTYHDLDISLSEYVDGTELRILAFGDDGDGVFDAKKDSVKDGGIANANFKTHRNLRVNYYAPMIMPSSASVVVSGEQMSGLKMPPPLQVDLTRSYGMPAQQVKNHFLVIHKDAGGLPGRVLGVSKPFADRINTWEGEEVFDLTEKVYNEMLFFVAYEDNGDGRFSLENDMPVRGQNNAIILVRFRVAPEFE